MPAPKGHPFWGNPIKPKKFKDNQELWDTFINYVNWNDENPLFLNEQTRAKTIIPKDSGLNPEQIKELLKPITPIPIQRPLSITNFCLFANIEFQTFENYSKAEGYESYFEIASRIRSSIRQQQIDGAYAGIYKENIVARVNGITDKSDITPETANVIKAMFINERGKNI